MKNCIVTTIVFLILFVSVRHLQPTGIVLYQGLALGLAVTLIQMCFAYWKQRRMASIVIKDGLLSYLLIYVFVFTVPTTVDRAYSVKMISHLAQAPDGLTREEIAKNYVADFVQNGGIDKRLAEQANTGSINKQDDRYRLTPLGRLLAISFRLAQQLFACGDASR